VKAASRMRLAGDSLLLMWRATNRTALEAKASTISHGFSRIVPLTVGAKRHTLAIRVVIRSWTDKRP
jgi:hypothetical protein